MSLKGMDLKGMDLEWEMGLKGDGFKKGAVEESI